jgi:hypothetical protein
VDINEHSTPERSLDTVDWLNCIADLDNLNDTVDDGAGDFESDIEEGNSMEDLECPLKRNMSAEQNVS